MSKLSPFREIKEVSERWLMNNGSIAVISFRDGYGNASGHIEGTWALHTWRSGKNSAGTGYDLVEQVTE